VSRLREALSPTAWLLPAQELAWRIPISAAAVFVCYRFGWAWLRYATSEGFLRVWQALGAEGHRVAFDRVSVNGETISFGVSCTFADILCASLPFLWIPGAGAGFLARRAVLFLGCVLVLNQLRVTATFAIYALGAPWRAADLGVGALAYLAVWIMLIQPLRGRAPAAGLGRSRQLA